jgi:hypothetical protein
MIVKSTFVGVVGFLALFISSLAFAGPEMPKELAAEFPQYPGSTVVHSLAAEGVVQVMLNCGKESMDTVFDFYKEKAERAGWTIAAEMKSTDGYQLMLSKNDRETMIMVMMDNGETTVVISAHQ